MMMVSNDGHHEHDVFVFSGLVTMHEMQNASMFHPRLSWYGASRDADYLKQLLWPMPRPEVTVWFFVGNGGMDPQ